MKSIIASILLALTVIASAVDITVAWDANTETDLAAYRVYEVLADTTVVQVSSVPVPVAGLPAPQYVFGNYNGSTARAFFVTAVNTAGLESGPSNVLTISKAPQAPKNLKIK